MAGVKVMAEEGPAQQNIDRSDEEGEEPTTDTTERSDVQHSVYEGSDGVTYLFTSVGKGNVGWPRNRREKMRKEQARKENNKRREEDKK
eukprot:8716248-Heterocapsa_arctica.AAC.1